MERENLAAPPTRMKKGAKEMNQVSLNKDDQISLKFHPREEVGDMEVPIDQKLECIMSHQVPPSRNNKACVKQDIGTN